MMVLTNPSPVNHINSRVIKLTLKNLQIVVSNVRTLVNMPLKKTIRKKRLIKIFYILEKLTRDSTE